MIRINLTFLKVNKTLGDIKEEESDYEKDTLPYIGCWQIQYNQILNEAWLDGAYTFKGAIQGVEHEEDEEPHFGDFDDDDGVGIGEGIQARRVKIIGEVILDVGFKFGKDLETTLGGIVNNVRLFSWWMIILNF